MPPLLPCYVCQAMVFYITCSTGCTYPARLCLQDIINPKVRMRRSDN